MRNTFTTDEGREIEFGVISMQELAQAEIGLEKEFQERGEPLEPPTYSVAVVGGDTTSYPHTANTLEVPDDPEATAANKAAWAKYVDATNRLLRGKTQLRNSMIFETIHVDIPADGSWEARCQRLRIKVPADPLEKRELYLTNMVLKTPNDMMTATEKVTAASMRGVVSEEEIAAQMRIFRSSVQKTAAELFGSGRVGNTAGRAESGDGTLAAQRKTKRGARSKRVGPDAEPVPGAVTAGPERDDGA